MKKILLLSFLLTFGLLAKAQPYMGLHFIGASPLNELCDSTYRNGFGFNLEFMSNNLLRNTVNPNILDFRIGGGFDVLFHGSERRDIVLNTPSNDPGYYSVNNNHIGLLLTGRFMFMGEQKVSPYIDAFVGPRFFNTTETIKPKREITGYEESSTNIANTTTFHYGASLGLMYNFNSTFSLDTRVTYSKGTQADWAVLSSAHADGNFLKYDMTTTYTDLFIYRVGIVIKFNKTERTSSNPGTSTPRRRTTTTPVQPKKTTVTPKPNTPAPSPQPVPVTPKPNPTPPTPEN